MQKAGLYIGLTCFKIPYCVTGGQGKAIQIKCLVRDNVSKILTDS